MNTDCYIFMHNFVSASIHFDGFAEWHNQAAFWQFVNKSDILEIITEIMTWANMIDFVLQRILQYKRICIQNPAIIFTLLVGANTLLIYILPQKYQQPAVEP